MPASNVRLPFPLTRLNPFYPGQIGVPGAWTDTGLRTHPTGTVFYVDPNYPGASDDRDGTDPTAPLLTVAAALTKCSAYQGDIIMLTANAGWEYAEGVNYPTVISEAVEVTVPGVSIVGAFGASSVGVVWSPPTAGATCITVSAIDVLIEGICFAGDDAIGGDAIYAQWAGGVTALWGDNLTVRNCFFDHDIDTAIEIEFAWYCDIHDNVFDHCGVAGIISDVGGAGADYNSIHKNTFINLPLAISLLGGASYNDIFDNRLYNSDAQAGAAAANVFINTTGGSRNLVHHNVLSCLLPVPAVGDYNNTCTAAGSDAWVQNYCLDGPTVTNPT